MADYGPSQAQTGLGALITGLASGYGDEKAAQRKSAYDQALFGQKAEEKELDRQVKLKIAGGGGTMELGPLIGLAPNDPRYKIPVPINKAGSTVVAGMSAAKPSVGEESASNEFSLAAGQFGDLAEKWKKAGFGEGTKKQAAGGLLTRVLPGQVSQRTVGPEYKEYNDSASFLAETALRAATGAATNPSEIKEYRGYMPEPGDLPEVAYGKAKRFVEKLRIRNNKHADRLEQQGLVRDAKRVRDNTNAVVREIQTSVLPLFGAPAPTPGAVPPPGGGSAGDAQLKAMGL
jgi:hypothetical protein